MLRVEAHVTREIFSESFTVSVPSNTTLTALDVARSMEQEDPLCAFGRLSLVSTSPSEAPKPIVVLPRSPTGQPDDPLQLTWSLPPDQRVLQLLQTLSRRVSHLEGEDKIKARKINNLEDEDKIKARKISDLEDNMAQVLPLADAIHLRCLMDVWLHEQGFGPGSGPRKTWMSLNKTKLSIESDIPEEDLEDFFEYASCLFVSSHALTFDVRRYRYLGDTNAHIVNLDGVARSVANVKGQTNDKLLQHTVDEELDEDQQFVTTINSARDVNPADRKKETLKAS